VLGNPDGEVGPERALVADLLPDPGLVRHLGETPDEFVARELRFLAGPAVQCFSQAMPSLSRSSPGWYLIASL
jgi:hypothetical protein